MTPDRGLRQAAFLVALVPFVALSWRFNFVCDDAFITFRYSKNFAEGHGLVYHVGTEAPVEGYSEFLWALLVGVGMKLGAAPEVLSRILSVASGVLLLWLTTGVLAQTVARRRSATLLASLLLGCLPPLAVWSTGGMATMPAAMLAMLLFVATDSERTGRARWLAPALAASSLALTRADGALLVALILAPAILGKERAKRRTGLLAATISAGAFGLHVLWRHATYGDWLPNTARAKLGFSAQAAGRGFDYVVSAFLSMPGLLLVFAGAAVAALWARRHSGGRSSSAAVVAFGVTAYSIAAGGDFMCFARFLVPALPFAVLGFGAYLGALEARRGAAAPLVIGGLGALGVGLAALDVHPVPQSVRAQFHFRHNQTLSGVKLSHSEVEQWRNMVARADEWEVIGRALAQHAAPGSSVVYGAVGAIGYFSGLDVFDRNGLVTREVAMRPAHEQLRSPGHDKVVPPQFFAKDRPTFLNVGLVAAEQAAAFGQRVQGFQVLGPTTREGQVLWVQRGPWSMPR